MHYSRKGCAFAVSRAATFDNISAFQLYQVQIIRQTLVKHTHTHTHTQRQRERDRERDRERERKRDGLEIDCYVLFFYGYDQFQNSCTNFSYVNKEYETKESFY